MLLLKAVNTEKSYADRTIFKINTLEIYLGEKIGIVGRNGSGKTTLLNVLSGEDKETEKGTIKRFCEIAYFHQFNIDDNFNTEKYINSHSEIADLFKLKKIDSAANPSGGEITKILLADTLNSQTELIFLDEPTSNLDMSSIKILEKQIKNYYGAVILISHDRQFLENICEKIIEIENGEINIYNCRYSEYAETKKQRTERAEFEYGQYKKEKNQLERAVVETDDRVSSMKKTPKRMGVSEARLHKRAGVERQEKVEGSSKAIQKRIEHLEVKEKPKKKREIGIELTAGMGYKGKNIVECENLTVAFGEKILFTDASFYIGTNSKTALIGDNGSGKTTLIGKILNGHENIRMNAKKVTYYNQKLDILNPDKTALENVLDGSPFNELHARNILGRLNIREDDVYKKAAYLSGGERVKVCFAKIFTAGADLVILDEPTNYIDTDVSDLLKTVLLSYEGTVLIVSHDRYFLNGTADNVLHIKDKKLTQYNMSFSDVAEKYL